MSDSPPEHNSNSQSNLIEVHHVGVMAKLQSPLKDILQNYSSSNETDNNQHLYHGNPQVNASRYNKLFNNATDETDTTTTDNSKILYEMKSMGLKKPKGKQSVTPSKIEFQLYTKSSKRLKKTKSTNKSQRKRNRKLFEEQPSFDETPTIFARLRNSFGQLTASNKNPPQQSVDKIFDDLPEPVMFSNNANTAREEVRIGIYPFDHGCAEYLKIHDCPPQLLSLALADKTTEFATKFWAEFFGSLYIGVAFVVTFLLQSYRFVLYSLINTLLVGMMHMTADYMIKPLLAAIFNGFLQPPLIFLFNILSSIRDVLEPIAEALNNFMKPLATLGKSVRLVNASYNKKNITKNV